VQKVFEPHNWFPHFAQNIPRSFTGNPKSPQASMDQPHNGRDAKCGCFPKAFFSNLAANPRHAGTGRALSHVIWELAANFG
jgi:hypothetical protein